MEKTKKIVIAVVVYDRIGNFIKWCKLARGITRLCSYEMLEVEIRIIHNTDKPERSKHWKAISENYPVTYINRQNKGLDIGAFQEVCEMKMQAWKNDFEFLIWFTDDCFPTSLDFISDFVNPFRDSENVGMTCFEVSKQVRPHARTTGFCLRRETLSKITFPVPVITTKQDCYNFEHGANNLYLQILKLGLKVVEIERNIFYNVDSPKCKKQGLSNLQKDLYHLLYGMPEPDVLIFATAYNRYPQIISSVACQKHENVKIKIWHDGKFLKYDVKEAFSYYYDAINLSYKEIGETAQGNYGHHLKKKFLEELDESKSEYILITNEDNYISPYFISKAVEILEKFPDKIGAYCSGMVHNYMPGSTEPPPAKTWREKKLESTQGKHMVDGHIVDGYGLIPCRIERGYIDISCMLFRTSVAKSIPWGDFSHSSDWDYIENIANAFGGKEKYISFPGIHLVHN